MRLLFDGVYARALSVSHLQGSWQGGIFLGVHNQRGREREEAPINYHSQVFQSLTYYQ